MKKRFLKKLRYVFFVLALMMLFVTAVPTFAKAKKIKFTNLN